MIDEISVPDNQIISQSLDREAIECKKVAGKAFLRLGAIFKEIRENKLWKSIDGGYDSWEQYLAKPELDYSDATASFFINVYEIFILKLEFEEDKIQSISQDKLRKITAKAKDMDRQEVSELVEQAITLSNSDFRKNLEDKGIIRKKKINIYRCDECKKLRIEYDPQEICACDGVLPIKPMFE